MTVGVLLINTGTPDAPTIEAIRPYLTEFLMDPAIIGAPYFVRKPLVSHIVKQRPERTVAHYQAFWTDAGSPFMNTSVAQTEAIARELGGGFHVELAMRYGNPSIRGGLGRLRDGGCETVVLVPLYPQNVNVCAGTCFKAARRCLRDFARAGWSPKVVEVPSFHERAAYRAALRDQVAKHWSYAPGAKLVVSFHSTMMSDIRKDDTYLVQATQTKDWLAEDVGVAPEDAVLCFQSRFDSRKWLQPFTEQTLLDMVAQGVRDVCVVCPGFVADNIETTIEVDQDLRAKVENAAERNGVDSSAVKFTYVPALGTDNGLIAAIAEAVRAVL